MSSSLLQIKDLSLGFNVGGVVHPVTHGVSFAVRSGSCVGVVGESGSGKSMTSLAVMQLLPPQARVLGGQILFEGQDLLALSGSDLCRIRGKDIAIVYQEPMTALNPVFTVGEQIQETIIQHLNLTSQAAQRRTVELLHLVGIPDPESRVRAYPHQLSGGMRQRTMIAMALACDPKLIIADEPTTALDVTVQAQILDLLRRLRGEIDTAIILITHDLGVVAEIADEIVVMYAGHVVEAGSAEAVFEAPIHPYTEGLLRSIPRIALPKQRLALIEGVVPRFDEILTGCPFAPRCPERQQICVQAMPPMVVTKSGGRAACWVRAGGVSS